MNAACASRARRKTEHVRIVDSRRVTGSNVMTREPGALVDIAFDDGDDRAAIIDGWDRALASVWAGERFVRESRGGAALFVTGPLDALMPLTDLNDWALGRGELPLDRIQAEIAAAHVPHLAELVAETRLRGVPLLVDEAAISVGAGARQLSFPRNGPLPPVDEIDWSAVGTIPIGIVTGTNGKTTTTRLVARMAKLAGRVAGMTSSDGVVVDGEVVQRGDFSGPEGTRMVLRDPRVELAVLETARGGILRRGLTVERCDAAVVTNVSSDHLGDYGVDDVATMARVKAVVGRDAKVVILNAADPNLVALAPQFGDRVVWFSGAMPPALSSDHLVAPDVTLTSPAQLWSLRDGWLLHGDERLIAVEDVPLTYAGNAAYNIDNALAAAALATALGISRDAIVSALRTFTSSSDDNPGRGNVLALASGVTVLIDFGHNPVAVRNVLAFARTLGTGALRVTIGIPGDRTDDDLREVARTIAAASPTQVVVRELGPDYLRGRAPNTIAPLLAAAIPDSTIAADELSATRALLAAARPGDVVVVLVHLDSRVDALLANS